MLPKRRDRERSGISRGPQRIWGRHRKFVRSHHCCVPGCEDGPIEFAHVRSAANSGTGVKPADWSAISLCSSHHAEQHRIGQPAFERRYGINLAALAAEFVLGSPDVAMRDAMKQELA
jgi:hypothetical protein